ncbi:hypothetical protein HOY82DRAFT_652043 [Tuber indicum]|nr:hypothetical protein HOY82DRAFT_652043 [Tuber indicum]
MRGKAGGGLQALGVKAYTGQNIKIHGSNRKNLSKFVAINDLPGDGVRAIVKDKMTTFLKGKKKIASLQRKPNARERHLEMVREQKKKDRVIREKEMAGKRAGVMLEEMIRMYRGRRKMMQLVVQLRKQE